MAQNIDLPPLIVHVIFSLGVGGLENGVVNLINQMPEDAYRHAIICIKNSTNFSQRIKRNDVEIYELNKKEGHDWLSFVHMYRLLRQLKPNIVHTRNLAAMEYQIPALLAGVKYRIHGEHGWDVFDPEGNNKKYQWLRRMLGLMIHRFIPLSRQLQNYLENRVGISHAKIFRICNGVDTKKFYPLTQQKQLQNCPLQFNDNLVYIGTVGRMHGVKDQMTLVKAFVQLLEEQPELTQSVRLILIGDGPIREQALEFLRLKHLENLAWLPGKRDDVAEVMRCLDLFVLPSKAEGISNTILEAMATGLPVVATNVGGNPELIDDGVTGSLVEKEDYVAMMHSIRDYLNDREKRLLHGRNACQKVLKAFSINVMVDKYMEVYKLNL
jgi:sugar transferase (PEP-CTERM/EpsH1 system associated)